MREIKFRLIKDNNIVGYEWHNIAKGQHVAIMHSKDGTVWANIHLRPENYIDHDNKEQFTGLPDKQGKKIYDGDTLKNPNDPRGNKLFDVAWSEMFHGWTGNSQTECLQMKPCVFDECEVISDIHEKPELLERKG